MVGQIKLFVYVNLGSGKLCIFCYFLTLFFCASSPVVHRELTDGGKRPAEKAGGRGHDNQTE